MPNHTTSKINVRWDSTVVPAHEHSSRALLIEVTAPPRLEPIAERPPINLALVIDRSGSMARGRLAAAKQAAEGIVSALTERDRLSLVIFDDSVETLFTGLAIDGAGRQHARACIASIDSGGMTDLSGGWFAGAQCAATVIDTQGFSEGNVLVLSDGQANRGICDPEELGKHAGELAERRVKTSAIGIGEGYSPLQLDALAEAGQGRLHDAETSLDILETVLGELGELNSIGLRDVEVALEYPESVHLELLTRAPARQERARHVIRLGDIVADSTRPVAVRVEVPALEVGTELRFSVGVSWRAAVGADSRDGRALGSQLNVVPPAQAAAAERDFDVVRCVADLWEAGASYRAVRTNEAGDYAGAALELNMEMDAYSDFVVELEDRVDRVARLESTRQRVSQAWDGRSKREAMIQQKKAMRQETDHSSGRPER